MKVFHHPASAGHDPELYFRRGAMIAHPEQAERYLRAAGIMPQERFELSSLLAIAMMVDRGLGVSLVPDIASPLLDAQRVAKIALPLPSEPRRFGILWLRSSARLPLIEGFVQSARGVAATDAVPGDAAPGA